MVTKLYSEADYPIQIDPAQEARIIEKLLNIEADYKVTILFACESGSRVKGIAGTTSDYDVRFVYIQRNEKYLAINRGLEQIERMYPPEENDGQPELDIVGWDIMKAARLLQNANPSILEWLVSPIIYRADPVFWADIKNLSLEAFSPVSAIHHYRGMAIKHLARYLHGEQVELKKYLYAITPLLACIWVEFQQSTPPLHISSLLNQDHVQSLPDDFHASIQRILEIKRAGHETVMGYPDPVLHDWIENQITYYKQYTSTHVWKRMDMEVFDAFCQRWMVNINGSHLAGGLNHE